MTMQNETNAVLESVKQTFAPVTDALKNIDVPEAARDFVKRAATNAKDRTADIHAGSEKVTSAIETAVTGSVSEVAKISRSFQEAAYEDATAFYAGIEKLAGAKSVSEAFQIQSELARAHGEVLVGRAKSAGEYVTRLLTDGARTAQDNFAKVASYSKSA